MGYYWVGLVFGYYWGAAGTSAGAAGAGFLMALRVLRVCVGSGLGLFQVVWV